MSEFQYADSAERDKLTYEERIAKTATMIDYLIIEIRKIDPICAGLLELAYKSLTEKIK